MATQKTPTVSQASNWPYIQKAAFWKEDKTAMKIVKILTSTIILPLAFLMDLINKASNYIWSSKVVEPMPKKGLWEQVKNGANAALDKVQDFWANHKKAIVISTSVVAGLATAGYFLPFATIGSAYCNKIGYFCSEKKTT